MEYSKEFKEHLEMRDNGTCSHYINAFIGVSGIADGMKRTQDRIRLGHYNNVAKGEVTLEDAQKDLERKRQLLRESLINMGTYRASIVAEVYACNQKYGNQMDVEKTLESVFENPDARRLDDISCLIRGMGLVKGIEFSLDLDKILELTEEARKLIKRGKFIE